MANRALKAAAIGLGAVAFVCAGGAIGSGLAIVSIQLLGFWAPVPILCIVAIGASIIAYREQAAA